MDKAKGELANAIKKANGETFVTVCRGDFGNAISASAASIICSEFADAPDELKSALAYLAAVIGGRAWLLLIGEIKEEDLHE